MKYPNPIMIMITQFVLSLLSLFFIFGCAAVILLVLIGISNWLEKHGGRMIDGMWIKRKFSKYEHCVACGGATNVPKDLDISLRNYYIEGSGQLCYDCYIFIYPSEHQHVR